MRFFHLQALILSILFLISCTGYVPPAGYNYPPSQGDPNFNGQPGPPPLPPRDDDDYDNRRERDGDRDDVLRRSRDRDRRNLCENQDRDDDCHDLCQEMYRRTADKEDCESLPVSQVDDIYDVHLELKNPRSNNLSRIELEDFEVYLNVSIAGFDRLIANYKKSDAEDVLIWMVENEDVTELFQDEDDDYRSFEALLEEATTSFRANELDEPFSREIDGDDTLFEFAIGNEAALEWFLDYIFETASQCTGSNQQTSEACFAVICKIGDGFGRDSSDANNREDWLRNSSAFENYIDDIIDHAVNRVGVPPGQWDGSQVNSDWTDGPISSVDDLDDASDYDFLYLCDGLF